MTENGENQNQDNLNGQNDFRVDLARKIDPQKSNPEQIEQFIMDIFHDETMQERIRIHLRNVIGQELSKMSGLLKNAVQGWIAKEKEKFIEESIQRQIALDDERFLELQSEKKNLEDSNQALNRKLQLMKHENQLMQNSLKQLMKTKL
ncbi:MAG: hypothetical protein OEY59_06545 [Deltaproteobacteria bacterium]|nr:hypothetical protein [Deltaproteobacteria bacterium]